MAVPVWKRKLSSAQFIYEVYTLNIRLGEILENKPQKYKANYADDIIKTALEALEHLQIADSIYQSWRGYAKQYNGYKTVGAMDQFFATVMKGVNFDT